MRVHLAQMFEGLRRLRVLTLTAHYLWLSEYLRDNEISQMSSAASDRPLHVLSCKKSPGDLSKQSSTFDRQ